MTLILTFLGKGGTGRSTMAIAAAQKLTNEGKRVLLLSQEAGPALSMLLGSDVGPAATAIGQSNGLTGGFQAVQLQTTTLLEDNWEKLKNFEAQYLRDPFFKAVFGQELSVIPGMDDFLALNAIREYTESGQYDVIVHDGPSRSNQVCGCGARLVVWTGIFAGSSRCFRPRSFIGLFLRLLRRLRVRCFEQRPVGRYLESAGNAEC